jgi:hypothetical protein
VTGYPQDRRIVRVDGVGLALEATVQKILGELAARATLALAGTYQRNGGRREKLGEISALDGVQ